MKYLKNPFTILAFGFTFLFFMPFPEEYLALKIMIALMVISYGITLGAFRHKNTPDKKSISNEEIDKQLEDIEKKLTQIESKTNEENDD